MARPDTVPSKILKARFRPSPVSPTNTVSLQNRAQKDHCSIPSSLMAFSPSIWRLASSEMSAVTILPT